MEEDLEINLYELSGTLKVSMVQIQHIPLIKIRHEDTQRGSDVSEKGIGSPYFKVQVGSYQFDFLEPVHEQEENDDGELQWVMKWKKDFVFELSGDMRELSFQLYNWNMPFQDGALGKIKIPMGELVNEMWAGKKHDMHSFLEDPHQKGEPLQGPHRKPLLLEFSVLWQPERARQQAAPEDASSALSSTGGGVTIKCRMCTRKVFLPRRMAPALRTQTVRKAAKPRRFTWLRNYKIEEPVVVTKIEVPRELFALPRLLAQLPAPMHNFLLHALQDWELAHRLRRETSVNNFPRLNRLVPLYVGGPGDGLEEAVAVCIWGVQDKAAELRAVTRDLVREEEYTERLRRVWERELCTQRRRFQGRPRDSAPDPDHPQSDRALWDLVLAQLDAHREHASHVTSAAATALRLFALAHVIERPLVVILDKAQEEGFPPVQVEPQEGVRVPVLERWALTGVYIPLLASASGAGAGRGSASGSGPGTLAKPCPVPLALSAHTARFSALVSVGGEESPLAHSLPDPPLLPLFSAGWLLPLPFCHVPKTGHAAPGGGGGGGGGEVQLLGREVVEGRGERGEGAGAGEEGEQEWRTVSSRETEALLLSSLPCAPLDHERALLAGVGASRRPTFSTNQLSLPVGVRPLLAVLHTAESKPDFLHVLRRFVLLGVHLFGEAQRHGGKELCWMEMSDYLELHRPWHEHPDLETQEAVRARLQEAAGSHKDLLGADPYDKRHEVVMDRYLHMLLYLASFIKIEHFDKSMDELLQFEKAQLSASRRGKRTSHEGGNFTF